MMMEYGCACECECKYICFVTDTVQPECDTYILVIWHWIFEEFEEVDCECLTSETRSVQLLHAIDVCRHGCISSESCPGSRTHTHTHSHTIVASI